MGWNFDYQVGDRVKANGLPEMIAPDGTEGVVVWIGRKPRSTDNLEFTYIDIDFDNGEKASFMEPASGVQNLTRPCGTSDGQ
jgi:hypothetical protein